VDWNPCSRTVSSHDPSAPSSHVIAVDSYVYVHCSSPDAGSYLMQCPGSMVWNPQVNSCMDFGGHSQTPPRLIGPLTGSNRHPQDEIGDTSTPSTQITHDHHQRPLHKFFARLPHALLSSASGPPSTLFRPSGGAGGLASQLTVNPCVVDNRGTLSPLRFHPHPADRSKYLECVPAERSVIMCYVILL